jgi:hypothetical protein
MAEDASPRAPRVGVPLLAVLGVYCHVFVHLLSIFALAARSHPVGYIPLAQQCSRREEAAHVAKCYLSYVLQGAYSETSCMRECISLQNRREGRRRGDHDESRSDTH